MKRRLTLVWVTCLLSGFAFGQNCTQKLNQAEDDYAAGKLLGIPAQIENCLKDKLFTGEEEIRARKLLTLVFIFTDNEAKAELAIISLLKADPEHLLDPQVDPAELFFLYNQFRTEPIFRIAFRAGANASFLNIIEPRNVANESEYPYFYNGKTVEGETSIGDLSPTSGLGIHFWGELIVEKDIYKGIELGFGPQFRLSRYNVETFLNNSGVNSLITDQQSYLRAPLSAKYTLGGSKRDRNLLPYFFGGASFDYLLAASYTTGQRSGGIGFTQTESDLIAVNQVERRNYSFFGGVGVKFRVKTHFLTLEARYDNSRLNYTNGQEAYSNQTSSFDLAYLPPDLSLNFISISLGYTHSIYSPKKLKEY